jgi:CheY-like chemotaxis protein
MAKKRMRILAIEPESVCRDNLRSLLAERIAADVVLVGTADAAAAVLRKQRPDLLLVSAVIPPRAEEQIMRVLKELDPYGSVPVLTIPPVVRPIDEAPAERGLFTFLKRKPQPLKPSYDPAAVAARIGETLSHLRTLTPPPRLRALDKPAFDAAAVEVDAAENGRAAAPVLALVKRSATPVAVPEVLPSLMRTRRRRAHRLEPGELPWPCAVTTPKGVAVRLLNVSTTGLLFESPLKFTPDSETSLYLSGPDTKLVLPARFVRSEVSSVDALGVKYQTAAVFSHKVKLFAALSKSKASVDASPQALADLLVRVTSEFGHSGDAGAARHEFETGLRQLVPSCEITLRDSLVRPTDGCDSIYFTVPSPKGAILQVTFDPDQEPSLEQFKLLRAAASVASVIVQYETLAATRTA